MTQKKLLDSQYPIIYLDLDHNRTDLINFISSESKKYKWECLHKSIFYNRLPTDIKFNGIITDNYGKPDLVKELISLKVPMVKIGNQTIKKFDHIVPAIMNDHWSYGQRAANFFLNKNFKTFAYIGSKEWSHAKNIFLGYKETISNKKLDCHLLQLDLTAVNSEQTNNQFHNITLAISNWLESLPKPIALLAFHAKQAARISLACRSLRLRIPEEVAILSLDNQLNLCENAQIPISYLKNSEPILAFESVKLLNHLMEKGSKPTKPILVAPQEIVEKRSTDILAINNTDVVRAIRIIWDTVKENISSDDIAKKTGVALRTLQRAFTQYLGRGINEELRRKRLEIIALHLQKNFKNIEELATEYGFSSMSFFRKSFKTTYGLTPNKYRAQYN